MSRIFKYSQFVSESLSGKTADEIADYIIGITPEESDVPDYFLGMIRKSGKEFVRKQVDVADVLSSDPSVREYVDSGEERYADDDIDPADMDLPIVVLDGVVMDGYSRIAAHVRNGENTIAAYVPRD